MSHEDRSRLLHAGAGAGRVRVSRPTIHHTRGQVIPMGKTMTRASISEQLEAMPGSATLRLRAAIAHCDRNPSALKLALDRDKSLATTAMEVLIAWHVSGVEIPDIGSVRKGSGGQDGYGTQHIVASENSSSDAGVRPMADAPHSRRADDNSSGQYRFDHRRIGAGEQRGKVHPLPVAPSKTQRVANLKALSVTVSIYNERLLSGQQIGELKWHEVRNLAARGTREAAWLTLIMRSRQNVGEFTLVREVIGESELQRLKQKAAEVQDAN